MPQLLGIATARQPGPLGLAPLAHGCAAHSGGHPSAAQTPSGSVLSAAVADDDAAPFDRSTSCCHPHDSRLTACDLQRTTYCVPGRRRPRAVLPPDIAAPLRPATRWTPPPRHATGSHSMYSHSKYSHSKYGRSQYSHSEHSWTPLQPTRHRTTPPPHAPPPHPITAAAHYHRSLHHAAGT